MRRKTLDPFFSPHKVRQLEPMLRSKVERFCARLQGFKDTGKAVPIKAAMTCLATDIVTEYAFAQSYGYLDREDFFPEWTETLTQLGKVGAVLRQVPWLVPLLDIAPTWMLQAINPGMGAIAHIKEDARAAIEGIVAQKDKGYQETKAHPTIFHELLASNMPAEEKAIPRIQNEGFSVVAAGAETTATVLAATVLHILINPSVEKRLRAELAECMPDASDLAPLQRLEKLPYLTGVVKEGLRLSHGSVARLQRISDTDLGFHGQRIPAGTPCATSTLVMHTNPDIWPEPDVFRPERWLDPGERERLGRYMVAFNKGSRVCLGIKLSLDVKGSSLADQI